MPNQKNIHLETLREIHRELWPERQAEHWSPSAGEEVIGEYFGRELEERDRQIDAMAAQISELRTRLGRHLSKDEAA